mmetsp:Transcript_31760/g.38911  ORF Transcript_31760/g.38911 Transcript_31760/m.38911 type:complete len:92 (-) Transcript_31760:49-324(-)
MSLHKTCYILTMSPTIMSHITDDVDDESTSEDESLNVTCSASNQDTDEDTNSIKHTNGTTSPSNLHDANHYDTEKVKYIPYPYDDTNNSQR